MSRTTFDVLVVDSDPRHRDRVAALLAREGMSPRCAGSAREALDLIANRRPQCILCDVVMRDMDGIEFLREIRQHGMDMPFVPMSDAQPHLREVYGKVLSFLRSAPVLEKPVKAQALLDVLQPIRVVTERGL